MRQEDYLPDGATGKEFSVEPIFQQSNYLMVFRVQAMGSVDDGTPQKN